MPTPSMVTVVFVAAWLYVPIASRSPGWKVAPWSTVNVEFAPVMYVPLHPFTSTDVPAPANWTVVLLEPTLRLLWDAVVRVRVPPFSTRSG